MSEGSLANRKKFLRISFLCVFSLVFGTRRIYIRLTFEKQNILLKTKPAEFDVLSVFFIKIFYESFCKAFFKKPKNI